MAYLEAQEVTYTYHTKSRPVHALRGVTARFAPGRMYAITGASGSGKSTLLSLLAGLDVPESGSILWDGQSTRELDRDRYRLEHAAVVYQSFNLFPHLTVLENAAYPLYLRGQGKAMAEGAARETLLAVGLTPDQFKRLPSALSGGQQQRVAIARALVSGSELILADEPTGNLDGENTRAVVDILTALAHREGRCVIVVTHDLTVAQRADLALRMEDGVVA